MPGAGAKAAGQLEWRWLCGRAGLPFFPHDFPDCPAAQRHAADMRRQQQEFSARRPAGRSRALPAAAPHFAQWGSIGQAAGLSCSTLQARLRCSEQLREAEAAGLLRCSLPVAQDAAQAAALCAEPQPASNLGAPVGAMATSTNESKAAIANVVEAAASSAGGEGALGVTPGVPLASATPPADALLPLLLRITGKGTCMDGAAVCMPSSSGGSRTSDGAAASGWVVAGYVTSAFPRGHPEYPGGRAACSRQLLLEAAAAQGRQRFMVAGRDNLLRLGLLNPGKSTVRHVAARVAWLD